MAADGGRNNMGRLIDPSLRDILIDPKNCDLGSIRSAQNLNNILDFGDPMPRLTKRGRCDPNYWSLRQACERWRYSRGLIQFTYEAVSNTYRINAGNALTLFQAGAKESATSQGYPSGNLSEVETDAFNGGAMADTLQLFQVRSVGFGMGIPFIKGTQFGAPTWTKRYSAGVLQSYLASLQAVVLENYSVVATYPQASPAYNLGPLSAWLPHANTQILGQTTQSGWQFGAGSIVPIDGELGGGASDSRAQLQFTLQQSPEYNLEVENVLQAPIPAVIYVPVIAFAYGFQTADCSSVEQCGIVTESDLEGAFARLLSNQLGVSPQQLGSVLATMRRGLPSGQ